MFWQNPWNIPWWIWGMSWAYTIADGLGIYISLFWSLTFIFRFHFIRRIFGIYWESEIVIIEVKGSKKSVERRYAACTVERRYVAQIDERSIKSALFCDAKCPKIIFIRLEKSVCMKISLCPRQRKRKSLSGAAWRKYDIQHISYNNALCNKLFHKYNYRKYIPLKMTGYL